MDKAFNGVKDTALNMYVNPDFEEHLRTLLTTGDLPLKNFFTALAVSRLNKINAADGWRWISDKVFYQDPSASKQLGVNWWKRTLNLILTDESITARSPNWFDPKGNQHNLLAEMIDWAGPECGSRKFISDDGTIKLNQIQPAMQCVFVDRVVKKGLKDGLKSRLIFHKVGDGVMAVLSLIWAFIFLFAALGAVLYKPKPTAADEKSELPYNQQPFDQQQPYHPQQPYDPMHQSPPPNQMYPAAYQPEQEPLLAPPDQQYYQPPPASAEPFQPPQHYPAGGPPPVQQYPDVGAPVVSAPVAPAQEQFEPVNSGDVNNNFEHNSSNQDNLRAMQQG